MTPNPYYRLQFAVFALVAAAFLLKGEGGSYGNGNVTSSQEKSLSTRDKNFFL